MYAEEQRKFKRAEETRRREQKNKILKWIAAPNKTEMEHRKHLETAEMCPENGRWLWKQHDEVSNWISEDLPVWPTVWVQGPRGMGKTILSSLVVRHLKELAEEGRKVPPDSQVCYFHCYSEDPELQTYLGILRGILHQLVSAAGVSGEPVSNNHAAILPLCDDKRTTSGGSTLTNPEAAAQLIEVFFEYNSRQYVVVDGLDECQAPTEGVSAEIQQTVQFLNQQVLRCDELSQGQLRVLFVSQSTPDVRKAMTKIGIGPNAGEVILDPRDNLEDIRRWVKKTVNGERQKFNLRDREKVVIEDHVTAQSEGMSDYNRGRRILTDVDRPLFVRKPCHGVPFQPTKQGKPAGQGQAGYASGEAIQTVCRLLCSSTRILPNVLMTDTKSFWEPSGPDS